jgi:hypothetical protein
VSDAHTDALSEFKLDTRRVTSPGGVDAQRYITIASAKNGIPIHSTSLSNTSTPRWVKNAPMLMGDTSMKWPHSG